MELSIRSVRPDRCIRAVCLFVRMSNRPLIDNWGQFSKYRTVSLTTEIDWMAERARHSPSRTRNGVVDAGRNIENNCQLLVAFVTWLTGQDVCFLYQLDHKISNSNCFVSILPQKQKLMVKSYKWPSPTGSQQSADTDKVINTSTDRGQDILIMISYQRINSRRPKHLSLVGLICHLLHPAERSSSL